MKLSITTWNVNSVRFRIDLVARFIKAVRPDVLCLQETKCPDDKFPRKRFKRRSNSTSISAKLTFGWSSRHSRSPRKTS